jgi:6-phosphogluconolactonase
MTVYEGLRVVQDGKTAAREAARIFGDAVRRSVQLRGRFTAAVPGGETPRPLFSLLGGAPYRDTLPWAAIHLFWTDERTVPPDHGRSNFRAARDEWLSRVAIPPKNLHRIHGEIPAGKAAMAYEAELGAHFGPGEPVRFDLAILGVGEDGHTASLFPGSRALEEETDLAVATSPPAAPGDGRVTLTYPALSGARAVLFLVTGIRKAEAMRRILGGGASRRECPAGRLQPMEGRVLWLLDRDAASLLNPARR